MDIRTDMDSLTPKGEITRREFVVTMLAAGFAAAVRPIAAQTVVHTDDRGLIAGEVKIPVKGGEIPAYRALPDKGEGFPVVLVVHEIFGVHEYLKDTCRRLAKAGYLAIAPELYARQGDVSKLTSMQEIMANVVSKVPDAQVLGDLDAAAAWAAKNGGAAGKLAITGFCWGGRIVWLYAAHNSSLKAAVAWYGRLSGDNDALHPKQPLDVAASLTVPVLGLYGGLDQSIPLDVVQTMQDRLRAAGSRSEIVIYPEAGHAFHADYRPSYRKDAAEDGWRRLLAWFHEHGVG